MKLLAEGSTRGRFVLLAGYLFVSFVILMILFGYRESLAKTNQNTISTAGITAAVSGYQTHEITVDDNAIVMVALGDLTLDEAATQEAEVTEVTETEPVAVFPVTPEMIDQNIPLEERPYVRVLAGLVEAEIGQVLEEEGEGVTFSSREEEIEAYKEGIAVVFSIFNRCAYDPNYPDDPEDNIYKRNQFAKPRYPYTKHALRAVELAIELWNEGRAAEILPPEYESFFGWGKHNYFYDYDNNYAIFEGLIDLPSDIKAKQKAIIPEL